MSKPYSQEEIDQTAEFDPAFARLMEEANAAEGEETVVQESDELAERLAESLPDSKTEKVEATPERDKVVDEVVDENNTVDSEPVKDVDYWKRKAEELEKGKEVAEKRQRDSQSALTPALQANAELRKEIEKLTEEVANLKAKMSKPSSKSDSEPDDAEEDEDEFTAELALKVAKKLERKLEDRLKPIEEQREASRKQLNEESERNALVEHYNTVKSVHADVDDFLGANADKAHGKALWAWAQEQPKWVISAVAEPPKSDPFIVAEVLTKFKNDVGLNRRKETPSLGDIAQAPRSNTSRKKAEDNVKMLTDFELRNINRLMADAAREGEDALNKLTERIELTRSLNKEK